MVERVRSVVKLSEIRAGMAAGSIQKEIQEIMTIMDVGMKVCVTW